MGATPASPRLGPLPSALLWGLLWPQTQHDVSSLAFVLAVLSSWTILLQIFSSLISFQYLTLNI